MERCGNDVAREEPSVVAQLVEALRYKPEDRGLDSRWGPCRRPTTLGSTHSPNRNEYHGYRLRIKAAGV
jgi:hypothetical protein